MTEWDPQTFVESLLESLSIRVKENIEYFQALTDLPHMEPRLGQLYLETYIVSALGFPNISLIMQGVLLEALVKEIIFENERKQYTGAFGTAIHHCKDNGYIDEEEFEYLDSFRDTIRNPYQHIEVEKISKESSVKGWKIPIDSEDIEGSLIKKIKEIRDGLSEPPETYTAKDLRPVAFILKQKIDEENYIIQFLQTAYFVRMMSRKYFPVD